MALVTTKKMFEKAFEGGYAIGAFNINNMEINHLPFKKKTPFILKSKKAHKQTD